MSAKAFSPLDVLRWISRAALRSTTKLVAYTLLSYADRRSGESNVRQSVLARDCGLKPRSIRSALREIESCGLISTRYVGGTKHQTRLAIYRLQAPAPTCRSLPTEAPAPTCRSLPTEAPAPTCRSLPTEAPAYNDTKHRHVAAANSGLRDSEAASLPGVTPKPPSVWSLGVQILSSAGRSEVASRSLIGKWIKTHGEEAVGAALGAAATKADPVAYVTRTLERFATRGPRMELIPLVGEDLSPTGSDR